MPVPERKSSRVGFSRRRLLGGAAGLGAVGVGAGIGWGAAEAVTANGSDGSAGQQIEPFYGPHQAGIATAAQAHAQFVGLDLVEGSDSAALTGILKVWTEDAARLTGGRAALADTEPELAHIPSRLTVTVGVGAGVFGPAAPAQRRPTWLRPLPAFSIDRINESVWGQTDLLLQVCGDDPTTVAHAVRVLTKNVRSRVRIAWVQRGFHHARGSTPKGTTMRNLMGQVDGTVNPRSDLDFDSLVWDDGGQQPWLAGGTALVLRRIAMQLDTWEELDRHARELTVGRTIPNGAPLTGTDEHDTPDFEATRMGIPVIPPSSHIARAHQRSAREQFLRRAYNYDDPPGPGETSNSGLIFAAYQQDVDAQFLPVQQRLADHDALNEWTVPIGSAVYAILPGIAEGDFLGSTLVS
ncbi:dye decolorizing peroxidase [Williamsia limnetica]|uniref:Dye decolorizing peroxidase n=1 Tax=Williamsia limnetica TaxID=882452 RepID=A0A318RQD0_WILLI|nr:Dyp-type peroxidase [Williamsia limnetica]PYE17486.1 dye decolorizing peroxidase [Williamsia limnetica]